MVWIRVVSQRGQNVGCNYIEGVTPSKSDDRVLQNESLVQLQMRLQNARAINQSKEKMEM